MKKVAIIIVGITILSRILGFGREITLAYFYGASSISDAYLVSLMIPNVIFGIVGAGIISGVIPIYFKIKKEINEDASELFMNKVIYLFLILTSIILVIVNIFLESIIQIFALGFSKEVMSLTIELTKITLYSMYFTVLISIFTGYLNIKNHYIVPTTLGLIYNVLIIVSIIYSYSKGTIFLAIGALVAAFLQMLVILFFAIIKGFKFKKVLFIKDPYLKSLLIMSVPIMLSQSLSQINVIVDKAIASTLDSGVISAINYADRINSLVLSTVVMTISTMIYPKLSKYALDKNIHEITLLLKKVFKLISITLIPTMVFILFFNKELTSLIFERGNFTSNDVSNTSIALFFYALGILFFAYREILTKFLFAYQNSKIPILNALMAVISNVVLSLILSYFWGLKGIVFATSIVAFISTIYLLINIQDKYYQVVKAKDLKNVMLILILAFIAMILPWQFKDILENYPFYTMIIQFILYGVIYLILLIIFKQVSYLSLINIFKKIKN